MTRDQIFYSLIYLVPNAKFTFWPDNGSDDDYSNAVVMDTWRIAWDISNSFPLPALSELLAIDPTILANFIIAHNAISPILIDWANISNKPTIPGAQIQSDWSQGSSSPLDFIKNKPSIPVILSRSFTTPTFSSTTTASQLSTTRDSLVSYCFNATVTISLLAGQSVTATLRYADNSGMNTNPVIVDVSTTSNSGVLGLTQINALKLTGIIPAGKYRQVTFSVTGSASAPAALASGQEVLL